MEKYERVLDDIYHLEDLINFIPMLSIACTVDNEQNTDRSIANFELLVQRYSLRMLYHAKNFIIKVLQFVKENENNVTKNNTTGLQIGLEVYFEFDAFLYSCKSIFEQNIQKQGLLYFSDDRKSTFEKISQSAYERFISNFLRPLRNEAVHLNYLGTSISQIIFITDGEGKKEIRLHTTFKDKNGQELNLMEIFIALFQLSNDVVKNIIVPPGFSTLQNFTYTTVASAS